MYDYEKEKHFIYTDEGIKKILEIIKKLEKQNKVEYTKLLGLGYSWSAMACIDWLEKNGIIRCLSNKQVPRNYYIYELYKE